MDSQEEHPKPHQPGHVCHSCGWHFPNPHPSAKHRKAHKRICGTIEGYKLIGSDSHDDLTTTNISGIGGSSHVSDDEDDDDDEDLVVGPSTAIHLKETAISGGTHIQTPEVESFENQNRDHVSISTTNRTPSDSPTDASEASIYSKNDDNAIPSLPTFTEIDLPENEEGKVEKDIPDVTCKASEANSELQELDTKPSTIMSVAENINSKEEPRDLPESSDHVLLREKVELNEESDHVVEVSSHVPTIEHIESKEESSDAPVPSDHTTVIAILKSKEEPSVLPEPSHHVPTIENIEPKEESSDVPVPSDHTPVTENLKSNKEPNVFREPSNHVLVIENIEAKVESSDVPVPSDHAPVTENLKSNEEPSVLPEPSDHALVIESIEAKVESSEVPVPSAHALMTENLKSKEESNVLPEPSYQVLVIENIEAKVESGDVPNHSGHVQVIENIESKEEPCDVVEPSHCLPVREIVEPEKEPNDLLEPSIHLPMKEIVGSKEEPAHVPEPSNHVPVREIVEVKEESSNVPEPSNHLLVREIVESKNDPGDVPESKIVVHDEVTSGGFEDEKAVDLQIPPIHKENEDTKENISHMYEEIPTKLEHEGHDNKIQTEPDISETPLRTTVEELVENATILSDVKSIAPPMDIEKDEIDCIEEKLQKPLESRVENRDVKEENLEMKETPETAGVNLESQVVVVDQKIDEFVGKMQERVSKDLDNVLVPNVESSEKTSENPIVKEPVQEEADNSFVRQPRVFSTTDISIDSSLDGNWGSVLSSFSDVQPVIDTESLVKTNTDGPISASGSRNSQKSDIFEQPSFMTLVEPEGGSDPKPDPNQAGWFPTLARVTNDSEGRKKNHEIISKVTNWNSGKQRTPLKSLLGEANPKENPTPPHQTDDKSDATLTENLNLGSEALPAGAAGKEWDSPARYPIEGKIEKRKVKGKPYWTPFLCCSSVN